VSGDISDPPIPIGQLARGFRKRTLVTAKTMARLGLQMARKNLGAAEIAERIDEDEAARAAEALLAELEGLKGFAMKLGQMVSYLDGSLPPKAQRVLARLQSASRPMDFALIASAIERELGAPPSALFDELEPTPIAAASIGQVHRGRAGGRRVAVKVQYPGIEELLARDLTTVGRLSRLALALTGADGKGLAGELRAQILAECDYEREARNQEQLRAALADLEDVAIPGVVPALSSRRVLTTELAGGADFYRFRDAAPAAARDRAGRAIYRAAFTTIFRHRALNADPHPGNYLFAADGAVTLLDFGCVKHFPPAMVETWRRLARSILDGDRARFRDAFLEAGFVKRPRRFDFDHQLEAMRVLYAPALASQPFTFTHEWIASVHDRLIFKNQNKLRLTVPPDWLFVNRLQFGLFSVLAHLGATGDWGALFREALEAPPTPER
jgi:predicted unusual protein kinase regulating ubiquinone biosynthesis (AarF/ABC1/UbiB family)